MLGYAFVLPESELNCSLLMRFYIPVRAGVRRIQLYRYVGAGLNLIVHKAASIGSPIVSPLFLALWVAHWVEQHTRPIQI